jgi:acyl-CoA synthetase (AMP-forming)/AMP-acid ligase II
VVPADASRPPDAAGLRRYARERLAGFKVPAFWYGVASLPHTSAGKLLRRELAAWHGDPAAAKEPLSESASPPRDSDIDHRVT